jgi:hypothetical protein
MNVSTKKHDGKFKHFDGVKISIMNGIINFCVIHLTTPAVSLCSVETMEAAGSPETSSSTQNLYTVS